MINNRSKFNPNEEKLEQQRKELLFEMYKLDDEMRKTRKKKFIIIFIIIVIVIAIIKIFLGTIELYNIFGASPSNARYYKVTVNGKQIHVSYTSTKKIPIIPFLVNFNSVYLGNNYIVGDDSSYFYSDGSDKYILDINSYNCYYENIQTECKYNDQIMKKNNDDKYTLLTITRTSNPYGIVYDGKYTENIAPYITTKGVYHVGITAKHGLTTDEIYFYFRNE